MNNDTDRTPGDHLVDEHLVDLLKLIGRSGRKITGLDKGRFVLVPVDGQAPITDEFSTLIRYDKPLHIEFECVKTIKCHTYKKVSYLTIKHHPSVRSSR